MNTRTKFASIFTFSLLSISFTAAMEESRIKDQVSKSDDLLRKRSLLSLKLKCKNKTTAFRSLYLIK